MCVCVRVCCVCGWGVWVWFAAHHLGAASRWAAWLVSGVERGREEGPPAAAARLSRSEKRAEEQELEFEEQAGNLTSQHAQKVAQWTADTIEKEKNMAFNDLVKKATGGLLLKDLNLATAVQHSQSAGLLNNAPANPAPPPPGGASTALVTSDVAARAQAAAAALGLAPAAPGGMAGGGALALMPGVGDAARMAALKAAQAVNNTGMGQEEAHASAELEINDYPQHARWKVTQKDNVAPVTEFNDVCVTAKVSFLAARLVKIPEV